MDVSPQLSRKSSDRLGRYYTDTGIGSLLVNQLGVDSPANVIDLGAGHGVLSMAAETLVKVPVDYRGCGSSVPIGTIKEILFGWDASAYQD